MSDHDWRVKLFADSACLHEMQEVHKLGLVKGFTTNPSSLKAAGIEDYKKFVQTVAACVQNLPLSFSILADDLATMEKEARVLSALGENVFVKIPVMNTRGVSTLPLIEKLSAQGCAIEVAAIFTLCQVKKVMRALDAASPSILSVCAGSIADTGVNAACVMREAVFLCRQKPAVQLLWAQCRESYNILEADRVGCDIISVPCEILKKLRHMDKNLYEFSLETVQAFRRDAASIGYCIL